MDSARLSGVMMGARGISDVSWCPTAGKDRGPKWATVLRRWLSWSARRRLEKTRFYINIFHHSGFFLG